MTARRQLSKQLQSCHITAGERHRRNEQIAAHALTTSPYLVQPDFEAIHPDDLRLIYELYDETYFQGLLKKNLQGISMNFRLSGRMTKAGGKTTQWASRRQRVPPRYEIAISTPLLFQSFQDPERSITVTGLVCDNRLQALMRVMEHELIHLSELLVWDASSCSRQRFQAIAHAMFGHTDHRHDLITPSERAAAQGIRPGTRVRFDFEGYAKEGIVNRVTKRATVLVADPEGESYSDGRRYLKYYIPLRNLSVVE